MKQQIISEVVQQMLPHLDNAEMQQLQKVLENVLFGCEITVRTEKKDTDDNPKLIDAFVSAKRIEGFDRQRYPSYSDRRLTFLSDGLPEQESVQSCNDR